MDKDYLIDNRDIGNTGRRIYNNKNLSNMKIIIKIGTAAIFNSKKQKVKEEVIKILAEDVSKLIKKRNEVIVVSSGAVGFGKNMIKGKNGLRLKQAQASVGQVRLMQKYSEIFSKRGLNIAQFLLSSEDLSNKKKMKNIKETYHHLKGKAIPIVNENDTTTIEELSFGDNDILASELLLNLDFDIIIMLTEMGALIKNKHPLKKSNLFSVEDYDKRDVPVDGFGGLKSKLESAKKIAKTGKKFIIARAGDSIHDILSEKVPATRFYT